jgi:NADPH:quinone reductase
VVARGDDVAARIREVMPEGVDAIADGSIQNELLFPAIRDGGGFVAVRGFAGAEERGIKFHVTWVWEYWKATAQLEQLRALVDSGAVAIRVAQQFPAGRCR